MSNPPDDDRKRTMRRAVTRMRVDSWTAEVVTELRAADVRPLLLKGPAVSRWLYANDPGERSYVDVDLLVSPADQEPAASTLGALGFRALDPPFVDGDRPHARTFWRERDGAMVDLHRVLHGMEGVPEHHVWRVVSSHTETMPVGEVDVEVPSLAVRALHVALHLSPHDESGSKVRSELELAARIVEPQIWHAAASIARDLG